MEDCHLTAQTAQEEDFKFMKAGVMFTLYKGFDIHTYFTTVLLQTGN